jgi:hypothetical protein
VIDCMDMPLDENGLAGITCIDLLHHVHSFILFYARLRECCARGDVYFSSNPT